MTYTWISVPTKKSRKENNNDSDRKPRVKLGTHWGNGVCSLALGRESGMENQNTNRAALVDLEKKAVSSLIKELSQINIKDNYRSKGKQTAGSFEMVNIHGKVSSLDIADWPGCNKATTGKMSLINSRCRFLSVHCTIFPVFYVFATKSVKMRNRILLTVIVPLDGY